MTLKESAWQHRSSDIDTTDLQPMEPYPLANVLLRPLFTRTEKINLICAGLLAMLLIGAVMELPGKWLINALIEGIVWAPAAVIIGGMIHKVINARIE